MNLSFHILYASACLFHIPFGKVGMGFCPIWGIWRGAGSPATSQMRCWLLPNGRIFPAAAGLLCVGLAYCACVFSRCLHVGATLAFPVAPHTPRSRGRKPHTAATRASRRGVDVRHIRRVDNANYFHGQKIGTFGTLERNPSFAVAAVRLG